METLREKIEELEREEIMRALRESGWVMARAARRLGITERVIGYKIQKYGIRTKEVRWHDNAATAEPKGTGTAVRNIDNYTWQTVRSEKEK